MGYVAFISVMFSNNFEALFYLVQPHSPQGAAAHWYPSKIQLRKLKNFQLLESCGCK